MAINPIVFYTPDRNYRITADTGNRAFRVERDLVYVGTFPSLPTLERWLQENGYSLDSLIQD